MRRTASIGAALALVLTAVVTVGAVLVAPASAGGQCRTNPVTKVVECDKGWNVRPPGDPGGPSGPGRPGTGPDDFGMECHYVAADPAGWEGFVGPPPSEDAILVFMVCSINGEPIQTVGPDTLPTWVVPGEEPPPDPAQIAATLYGRVINTLQPPDPLTDPPEGTPSVIHKPTFVAVANWQGTQGDQGCLTGGGVTVCVAIEAVPSLAFDPGDGSPQIPCEDGGTRYDRAGPPADAQAEAEGACAHVYRRRTGVDGRPDAWPGQLVLTWDIRWWTIDGGPSATFEPVVQPADVPRAVEEVQSVIEDT